MRESERTESLRIVLYLVAAVALLAAACTLSAGDRPVAHGMIDKVYSEASGEHRYVVVTDDTGVSLVFAVAGAAIDSSGAPDTPRVERLAGFAAGDIPKLTSLQVGIAPIVLHALSGPGLNIPRNREGQAMDGSIRLSAQERNRGLQIDRGGGNARVARRAHMPLLLDDDRSWDRWEPHGSRPCLSGCDSRTTASVELRFSVGDIRYPGLRSPAGGGQGLSHVLVGVSRTEPVIYTDRSRGFVRRHAGCIFLVPFADLPSAPEASLRGVALSMNGGSHELSRTSFSESEELALCFD